MALYSLFNTMWVNKIYAGDVHVVPCDAQGNTTHELSLDCKCNPQRKIDSKWVVIHEEIN